MNSSNDSKESGSDTIPNLDYSKPIHTNRLLVSPHLPIDIFPPSLPSPSDPLLSPHSQPKSPPSTCQYHLILRIVPQLTLLLLRATAPPQEVQLETDIEPQNNIGDIVILVNAPLFSPPPPPPYPPPSIQAPAIEISVDIQSSGSAYRPDSQIDTIKNCRQNFVFTCCNENPPSAQAARSPEPSPFHCP